MNTFYILHVQFGLSVERPLDVQHCCIVFF